MSKSREIQSFRPGQRGSMVGLMTNIRTRPGGQLTDVQQDENSGHREADGITQVQWDYSQPFSRRKQVHVASTFLHAADHSKAQEGKLVFPVNPLTLTIKCRFTHSSHQARNFIFEGKQG